MQTYRALISLAVAVALILLTVIATAFLFAAPRWSEITATMRECADEHAAVHLTPMIEVSWDSEGYRPAVTTKQVPGTSTQEWVDDARRNVEAFQVEYPRR